MPPKPQPEATERLPGMTLYEEAVLNIARTAAIFEHAFSQALKPHGITIAQYNVLRILRRAGTQGLCRYEIGERLIRAVPDVTRLLDRLEQMGLIARDRAGADRRFVTTCITSAGLDLLCGLDTVARDFHHRWLQDLTADELQTLIGLLARVRRTG